MAFFAFFKVIIYYKVKLKVSLHRGGDYGEITAAWWRRRKLGRHT